MILALLSLWQQPIEISRSTDRRQLGIMLPIGVMIKDPSGGGGGGNADTLNGQVGSYYLDRSNHTGTQAISTVSGLEEALDNLAEADSDLGGQIVAIQNTLPNKADLVGGVIPSSQIPAIAITEYLGIAADQAEMLALVGQLGDWCHRTDLEKAFIIIGEDTTDPASWKEWPMPISAVTSVNGQVGVVVLNAANIGINSSDNIAEGSSNLYFTTQRVRDATLTGFSPTNSAIISTDNVVQAFGKAQGQLNGMDAGRSLVHKTLTRWKSRSTVGNLAPFDLAQRGVFDTNFVIPANTLVAGDVYRFEMTIFIDVVSAQSGSYEIAPIFNDGLFPFAPTNAVISLGTLTVSQSVQVVFDITFPTVGASGRIIQSGILTGRNALVFFASNTSPIDTTQPVSLNYSARFTSTVGAGNGAYIKSARLYKLADPT